MKILHLIGGGDTGGAKTHIISILSALTESDDVSVRLVSFREGPSAEEARAAGIDVLVISTGNPLKDLHMLLREVRGGGYALLHSHGAKANAFALCMKLLTGIPTLSTLHSDYRKDYLHSRIKQLTLGTLNALALRRLDFRAGVADSMARMLISRGFDPQRTFHVNNGIDFSNEPEPMTREAREAFFAEYGFKVEEDDIIVGIATRIHPVKDLQTLIRAFAKAHEKCPALKLVIAGDGDGRAELEILCASLGLLDVTLFAGWLSDTGSFYNAIDISVLTSLSEGFPYSLLEGALARCATVSTAVGGIPELIDDAVNGYLFEPRDVDKLAELLVDLAGNHEKLRMFGDLLFAKASELYSLKAGIAAHKRIYRHICSWDIYRKQKPCRVLICGAYGFDNAGDDGILKAILYDIRALSPHAEVRVMSRKPKSTRLTHRVNAFYTFNIPAFKFHALRGTLYLNGGGTLITDITSGRSLLFYLYSIAAAKIFGCNVLLYGCGIGPISHEKGRKRTAAILDRYADAIVLREARAAVELTRLGVTNPQVTVTADPAINLMPSSAASVTAIMYRSGIPDGRKLLGIAVRRWKDPDNTASAVAFAADKLYKSHGFEPVFIPMQPDDAEVSSLVASLIDAPCHQIKGSCTAEEIIGVIGRMDIVLGMRLHSLIFAASQNIPFAGIAYDVKVKSFINSLLPCYDGSSDKPFCLPVEGLDGEELYAALSGLTDNRHKDDELSVRISEYLTQNASNSREIMKGYI